MTTMTPRVAVGEVEAYRRMVFSETMAIPKTLGRAR